MGDGGFAAFAPGGEHAFWAQQDGGQTGDLVEGLAWDLADQVAEGAQQGADDDAQQHVGQQRAAGVGEQGEDGAGLVDAVRVAGVPPGAVDGAAFAGGGLGVPQDGLGGDEDGVAGGLGTPAEVDVVAHEWQVGLEPAELFPHVAAHEHAGGGDGQHLPDLVVLALVLFAAFQTGPAAAGAGDADADLQQGAAVVPAADLGADDGGRRGGLGDPQHFGEGVGGRFAVVVQQPQPLHGVGRVLFGLLVDLVVPGAGDGVPGAGALQVGQVLGGDRRHGADRFGDGRAEPGAAGQVQDALVAEGLRQQACAVVAAAGVGGDGVLHGAFLAEQTGQGVGQPAGAVVCDEDRRDDVTAELRRVRGAELALVGGLEGPCGGGVPALVAVHGHRGAGPGSLDCGGSRGGPACRRVPARPGRLPRISDGHPH